MIPGVCLRRDLKGQRRRPPAHAAEAVSQFDRTFELFWDHDLHRWAVYRVTSQGPCRQLDAMVQEYLFPRRPDAGLWMIPALRASRVSSLGDNQHHRRDYLASLQGPDEIRRREIAKILSRRVGEAVDIGIRGARGQTSFCFDPSLSLPASARALRKGRRLIYVGRSGD